MEKSAFFSVNETGPPRGKKNPTKTLLKNKAGETKSCSQIPAAPNIAPPGGLTPPRPFTFGAKAFSPGRGKERPPTKMPPIFNRPFTNAQISRKIIEIFFPRGAPKKGDPFLLWPFFLETKCFKFVKNPISKKPPFFFFFRNPKF